MHLVAQRTSHDEGQHTHDDLSQLLLAAHRHGDSIGLFPKVQPMPTLDPRLGEDANKQPFPPPESAHQGVR